MDSWGQHLWQLIVGGRPPKEGGRGGEVVGVLGPAESHPHGPAPKQSRKWLDTGIALHTTQMHAAA